MPLQKNRKIVSISIRARLELNKLKAEYDLPSIAAVIDRLLFPLADEHP